MHDNLQQIIPYAVWPVSKTPTWDHPSGGLCPLELKTPSHTFPAAHIARSSTKDCFHG